MNGYPDMPNMLSPLHHVRTRNSNSGGSGRWYCGQSHLQAVRPRIPIHSSSHVYHFQLSPSICQIYLSYLQYSLLCTYLFPVTRESYLFLVQFYNQFLDFRSHIPNAPRRSTRTNLNPISRRTLRGLIQSGARCWTFSSASRKKLP